ncbi:MAG: helix-turn-helix domain-containing protein [Phycisphaerales bacterium]
MAKMFYTLDEAAERLKKSPDEVREMAQKGQIQEFRDRDRLMFKTDQIDLLAADEEHGASDDDADLSSMIPLADSGFGLADSSLGESALGESAAGGDTGGDFGGGLGESESVSGGLLGESGEMGGSGLLGGSGSGMGADPFADSGAGDSGAGDKKERTGVGIFDADELEDVDPSEMTVMSGSGSGMALDSLGSGSGLMDLTRESDDTSLGADFLEELTPGEEGAASAGAPAGGGGLFEGEDEAPVGAGAGAGAGVAYAVAEPYDGAGSGFVGGLSLGAVVALGLGMAVVVLSMLGAPDAGLMDMISSNFLPVVGGLAGLTVLLGLIGFVLGRRG